MLKNEIFLVFLNAEFGEENLIEIKWFIDVAR